MNIQCSKTYITFIATYEFKFKIFFYKTYVENYKEKKFVCDGKQSLGCGLDGIVLLF